MYSTKSKFCVSQFTFSNILLCFFLVTFNFIHSQTNNSNFVIDFLTTKQGLSHNYVTGLVSDDLNMKWIGTENGITKFDGYNFDYIKPNEKYKELYNENIEVLFMDKNSNLWIGTKSGGLSFFDIKNNIIKNFNHLIDVDNKRDLRITAISQDSDGNIWVGTWKRGLFILDLKEQKTKEHFNHFRPIYSIKKDFKNNIWYCVGNSAYKYDSSSKEIIPHNFGTQIADILSDSGRNKIWFSTVGVNDNLFFYNCNTNSFSSIKTKVQSNYFKKLSLDTKNRIWIGTWKKGVYRSNENLTAFEKINLVSETSDKIKGNYNTVLNIHHDENITWLSTAGGGVVKLLEGNGFQNIFSTLKNKTLKDNLNCTSFYEDENEVFVGTISDGLYKGKDITTLTKIKQIGKEKINEIYKYKNELFIGTSAGYYIYNLIEKKISFSFKRIRKITSFLIYKNKLFLGTQQNGIALVPLNKMSDINAYQFYSEDFENNKRIESDRITSIKKDQNNNIWVGSYNGLHLFDQKQKKFIHQSQFLDKNLPSVIINTLEIMKNNIWLATPNGLVSLSYKNSKLSLNKIFTTTDGLNNDFICSLVFDENENLWMSTLTEIVKYDLNKEVLVSFGDINGIKSTSFNNNSSFNYENQKIYFGGVDNVTFFNPEQVKAFENKPEVIFTNLRVNNKLISYDIESKILDKNFNYARNIKLNYDENFFSTSFVANDYLGNLNIKYRYKLEGNQNQWINLQNRNEINFAGLSPGNYVLKVAASRDNQNWSTPKSLNIELSVSPYKSPFAILLYIIIIASIIFYLVKANNDKIRLQNNLEIAKIDKEKEVELTNAKLNFFTNISHEFRTPLTLIISPLQELLESETLSPKVYKRLSYIDKNTNRLLTLINQLLDFRKADHGLLKLDVSRGNFVRFSNEVYLYFKESAKEKEIKYTFKADQKEINFPFDRNKMEIVLCNILSNALKYTSKGDKIKMTISQDDSNCIIKIKDSGIGMKAENLDKIFDRFFQIKTANTASMVGSGIGLAFSKKIVELHYGTIEAKSKENEGTEFTIKLAMNEDFYKGKINEEFLKSDNIKGYAKNLKPLNVESLNIKKKEHTVLIIDDNPEILDYLKEILADQYELLEARDGEEGLEKATSEIPDLIISDVMMPKRDGISLCKELKSQITTSHIPVILLTARTSTVFEIEGLKTGANDYVTKPFNANIIKARVESLLENREKLRAHLLNKVRFEPVSISDENAENKEDSFINKAILLVENNLENEDFGIDTMIEELYMSRSSLFRKIKSLTGLSLSGFIRSIRLKRAAYLILTSELNLSQISYEVGFNDYKYFKNSFKKQFKCLPSKYKELQTQKSDI